ncbi:MAG: LON peptidase substrate-binding domain-containing protein [Candidatus Latescibacteria bacterium]|jgi:ATP-dependent Lon protease|nr:LON peptidase substrate-binding domain-containing protein [Candidatus Latescibacterota bacterium]
MTDLTTIPLFPLQIVVFPGQAVPLYIFEPRYRQLFAEVRAAEEWGEVLQVGIVLGQDRETQASVGCTVELRQVVTQYGDGRLQIVTEGMWRFRIDSVVEVKPYVEAWVEYIKDEEEPPDQNLIERALAEYRRLVKLAREETGTATADGIPTTTWQLAEAVVMDVAQRQQLLEMTSENGRLQALCDYFGQLALMVEQRRLAQRQEGSDGHFSPN